MNDHEYYLDLCSLSLDGELSAEERASLEAHLAACPECAAFQEELRAMRQMLAADDITPPPSLHEEIMERVLAEAVSKAAPVPKRRFVPVFTLIAAAAVVVLLVTTGTIGNWTNLGFTSNDTATMSGDASAGAGAAQFAADGATFEAAMDAGGAESAPAEPSAAQSAVPESDQAMKSSGSKAVVQGESTQPAVTQDQSAPAQEPAAQQPAPAEGGAPQVMTAQPRVARGADVADAAALPATPAALQEQSYAFCYVASGAGSAPDFGGTLVAESEDGTAHYYTLKNSAGDIEKAVAALKDAGFACSQRAELDKIVFDKEASLGLVIVIQ